METYNEMEQYEIIDEVEQVQPTEEISQKELTKRVTDTIVALVEQANAIAAENSSSEDSVVYYPVQDATTYIEKTDTYKGRARKDYDELKEMKKAHSWTVGRNKAKIEKTQTVLGNIIDAVDNNADATKALFNAQTKMAEFSKQLYAIGLMGIASNRIVVREIKLRLDHASKEELSDLARQELEYVLDEIERQRSLENKVESLENKVDENQADVIARIEAADNAVNESKKHFETKLDESNEKREQLAKQVEENHADVIAKINATDNDANESKKQFETMLNKVDEKGNHQAKLIEENYKTLKSSLDAHDNRLDLLEKKTFLDSSLYKVLVGVAALGALVFSLLIYFG